MAGVFRENDRKSSERIDNSGRFESSSRRSARTSDPVRAPLQAAMRLALRRPRASATRPHTQPGPTQPSRCEYISRLRPRQWHDVVAVQSPMTLNEHPHSVPVAICRATALVVLRALPCGVITCRGRVEPIEVYLVVEETGASVLPANLATMYAQRHVEEYLAEIGDVAPGTRRRRRRCATSTRHGSVTGLSQRRSRISRLPAEPYSAVVMRTRCWRVAGAGTRAPH